MLLGLYKTATFLALPFLDLYLKRRVQRGKEDASRLCERRGQATLGRPAGPLLWVHAASVGESLLALPLIATLLDERPNAHALITTGTVTSAKLMAERLPSRTLHQFAPLDQAGAWQRFFDHWRPDLGMLIESEIWPHLILESERKSLPLALINARISARSARRWGWADSAAKRLLGTFALCLARSEPDAHHFSRLGAVDVRMLGDLKNATPPLPYDLEEFSKLKAAIGDRPVLVAASTHPGEEVLLLSAHQRLREKQPDLLTIIVPRHPERSGDIKAALSERGVAIARRSRGEPLPSASDLYLADTLGELGLFYRLATLAFIGGSLVPHGGQNPLEAARLGCPPVFGPHTGNFDEMTRKLIEAGAAKRVTDIEDLVGSVSTLLIDQTTRDVMAAKGIEAGVVEAAVLDHVRQALQPLLDRQLGSAEDSIELRRASA